MGCRGRHLRFTREAGRSPPARQGRWTGQGRTRRCGHL